MYPPQLFFLVIGVGVILELLVFAFLNAVLKGKYRVQHKYTIGKTVSLISIPILGLLTLVIYKHYSYVELFLVGALVGTLTEFICGWFFARIEGKRIWTYNYASIKGHTSYFSIPYWGGATLLFVLVSHLLKL
jgi:hypothetical protein